MSAPGNQAPIRVLGVILFTIAALLLTSIGGLGIVAAPPTLPLLFLVVRAHPTRAFRIAGAFIGGLTAAELGWGALYVVTGEVPVASWLLPLLCGVATAFVFTTLAPPNRRPSPRCTWRHPCQSTIRFPLGSSNRE